MNNLNKKPWYKKWWAITLFILIGLSVIGSMGEKPATSTPNDTPETVQTTETAVTSIFDLEALYGKNIDEIRTTLGDPSDGEWKEPTALQIEMGTTEWNNTFKKEGYELLVTYDVGSRKVTDFFLSTNDPSGLTKDTESLKMILNINNSSNYTIDPVESFVDSSSFTGIIAIPR